jgi:hypothetical protein
MTTNNLTTQQHNKTTEELHLCARSPRSIPSFSQSIPPKNPMTSLYKIDIKIKSVVVLVLVMVSVCTINKSG